MKETTTNTARDSVSLQALHCSYTQRRCILTGEEQDEAAREEVRVGAEPGDSDGHGLRQRAAHGVVSQSVDVVAESSSHTRRS